MLLFFNMSKAAGGFGEHAKIGEKSTNQIHELLRKIEMSCQFAASKCLDDKYLKKSFVRIFSPRKKHIIFASWKSDEESMNEENNLLFLRWQIWDKKTHSVHFHIFHDVLIFAWKKLWLIHKNQQGVQSSWNIRWRPHSTPNPWNSFIFHQRRHVGWHHFHKSLEFYGEFWTATDDAVLKFTALQWSKYVFRPWWFMTWFCFDFRSGM